MSFFLHIHFSQAIQVLPLPREGYIQHASSWNIVKQIFCIIPSQVFSIDCSIIRFEAILILCCIFFTWNIYEDHTHIFWALTIITHLWKQVPGKNPSWKARGEVELKRFVCKYPSWYSLTFKNRLCYPVAHSCLKRALREIWNPILVLLTCNGVLVPN